MVYGDDGKISGTALTDCDPRPGTLVFALLPETLRTSCPGLGPVADQRR